MYFYMYMCVCVYVCVCMYVCKYVRTYVCMYVYIYICHLSFLNRMFAPVIRRMQMKGMPVTIWPGSSLPTCSLRANSQRCWQSWRHPGQYHTAESNLTDLLVNPLYSICSSQFFPVNPSQLAVKLWKKPLYPGGYASKPHRSWAENSVPMPPCSDKPYTYWKFMSQYLLIQNYCPIIILWFLSFKKEIPS